MVRTLEEEVRRGKLKSEADLKRAVQGRLATILEVPDSNPGAIATATDAGPTVMVFIGVNGVGKTTSVAKLGQTLVQEGRKPLLAAADTYRAGAIDQLRDLGRAAQVPCVMGAPGGDPAAVAFDGIEAGTRGAHTWCWWTPPAGSTPRKV